MADLNFVVARTLSSSIQPTSAVTPGASAFQDIYQRTSFQPGLIRQIEEVSHARQAERVAFEQSLGDALAPDAAGESALTPLKMRAATRQLAELNLKNTLTVKTVGKTVEAFNQLARGS